MRYSTQLDHVFFRGYLGVVQCVPVPICPRPDMFPSLCFRVGVKRLGLRLVRVRVRVGARVSWG